MIKFERSAAWRHGVVLLAISISTSGWVGIMAAQSGEELSKPPAAANKESKKDPPAPAAEAAPQGQPSSGAAPAAGLRVVKDPETGKLRGLDRAEAAKFGGPAMNRSIEGLRPERRSNGVTVVDLEGRFQSYTVATRKSTGGFEIECQNTAPGHTHTDDGEGANAGPADPEAGKDSAVSVHAK